MQTQQTSGHYRFWTQALLESSLQSVTSDVNWNKENLRNVTTKVEKLLPLKWINGKPGHGESSNKGTMDFSAT